MSVQSVKSPLISPHELTWMRQARRRRRQLYRLRDETKLRYKGTIGCENTRKRGQMGK